jgi:diacylglycerol kinase family enzyme
VARALIIGTSLAGHGGPAALRVVARTLVRGDWRVETELATDQSSLSRLAKLGVADGVDVVGVIGGDGTVRQVAGALSETDVNLAIIPAGTGNLLAENLDVPFGPVAAARTILTGRTRRIDLGRVSGYSLGEPDVHFAVACGVGFDARVLGATPAVLKRHFGKLAYVLTAATLSPWLRNEGHVVTIDGISHDAPAAQVLIANFGRLARHVEANWPIRPDDGILDVIVINAPDPVSGTFAAWEALRHGRRDRPTPGARHLQGRDVRIVSQPSQVAEVDGDLIGQTPVAVSVVPGALSLMVPPG